MEGNAANKRPPAHGNGTGSAAPPDTDSNTVVEPINSNAVGTLSWAQWDAAAGVVSLGGDAVDDCDRLYDGR